METPVLAALFILQVIQCAQTEWSPWSSSSPCSHTCGLGISYQTRSCLEEQNCFGANRRYSTCNIQPCPKGTVSLRESLCKQFNNISLSEDRHDWLPHHDSESPCSLSCKDSRSGEVYSLQSQVEDGTPCRELVSGLCVNGICQKLGCDGDLGGQEVDKCGKCGGDGNSCYTISRSYSLVNHFTGYNDIFEIPVEATNILIVERHPGKHYLALRNQKGKYYLNGDWKIVKSTDIELAGTTFHYHHPINTFDEAETLTAEGPTNERVMLTLLYQDPDPDVKVEYKYSLPLDADLLPMKDTPAKTYLELRVDSASVNDIVKPQVMKYTWISGPWKDCSEKCGGGHQSRHVKCLQRGENKVVNRELCEGVPKPLHRQKCNIQPCHKSCLTSAFGCCPDGKTPARGDNQLGCSQPLTDKQSKTCQGSNYGCCEDGIRRALGPNKEGCPQMAGHKSCAVSDFGCCADGVTKAQGKNQEGCPYDADLCLEPRKKGKCRARLVRYYFDQDLKACKKFMYGGCRGNGNRFESKLECEMNCRSLLTHQFSHSVTGKDVCNLPHDLRQCKEQVVKWYYDKEKNLCSRYWFGGCSEGGNHFDNEEACLQTCQYHGVSEPKTTVIAALALCQLPSDPGPCTDGAKRWYYDVIRAECLPFAYGGCQGNTNNFETVTDCERMCSPTRIGKNRVSVSQSGSYPGVCMRPRNERLCTDWVSRWYFNTEKKTCEDFWFGGCSEDNANVFSSEQDCQNTCLNQGAVRGRPTKQVNAQCSQPPDRRSCGHQRHSWFYSKDKQRCERFVWGGCSSGAVTNRFNSEEECKRSCDHQKDSPRDQRKRRKNKRKKKKERVASGQAEMCSGMRDTRICGTPHPKWFYNTDNGYCEQIWDGGCVNNPVNLFNAEDECNRECRGYRIRSRIPSRGRSENRDHRTDVCFEKKQDRYCGVWTTMWFYNHELGTCQNFWHGGCGTGGNQFVSEEECKKKCVGGGSRRPSPVRPSPRQNPTTPTRRRYTDAYKCSAEADDSLCGEYVQKWRYNEHNGRCETFWHGGCPNNLNVYDSQSSCRRECEGRLSSRTTPAPVRTLPNPAHNLRLRPNPAEDVCGQHKDTRYCGEWTRKWFYNSKDRKCESFYAGGCSEGGNQFDSENDCRRKCEVSSNVGYYRTTPAPYRSPATASNRYRTESPVRRTHSPGQRLPVSCSADKEDCGKWRERWYYDTSSDRCVHFWHGSCTEGGNQFSSELDCQRACPGYRRRVMPTARPSTRTRLPHNRQRGNHERCLMKRDENICGDWENMWYYDSKQRTCKPFWFASCGMMGNKFATEADCQHTCLFTQPPLPDPDRGRYRQDERCFEEKDTSLCRSWRTRWFYNQNTRRCQDFLHGGCTEGGNQFLSEQECHERCQGRITPYRPRATPRPVWPIVTRYPPRVASQPVMLIPPRPPLPGDVSLSGRLPEQCLQEKDTKYCGDWTLMWYYNRETRSCEKFVHGGCGLRENRFSSRRECRRICDSIRKTGTKRPVNPRPVNPRPVNPRPVNPRPVDPRPVNPRPVDPRPVDPRPRPVYPRPVNPRPVNPRPVDPRPVNPRPVNPRPRPVNPRPRPVNPRPSHNDRCMMEKNSRYCGEWRTRWFYNRYTRRCEHFLHGSCSHDGNVFTSEQDCQYQCRHWVRGQGRTADYRHWPNYQRLHERCLMDKNTEHCGSWKQRWFYDQSSRSCTQFMDGGCDRYGNVFTSQEECHRSCPGIYRPEPARATPVPVQPYRPRRDRNDDRCLSERNTRSCRRRTKRWYFNKRYNRCEEFQYGGCDDDGNQFSSRYECQRTCLTQYPNPVTRKNWSNSGDICNQDKDVRICGECRSKWYYNNEGGRCERFLHCGCTNSDNKFDTFKECDSRCSGSLQPRPVTTYRPINRYTTERPHRPDPNTAICNLPKKEGRCYGAFSQWYYDTQYGSCLEFNYGGCDGNANNFDTENECILTCDRRALDRRTLPTRAPVTRPPVNSADVCDDPVDTRLCGEWQNRWKYNSETSRCETFWHGGCSERGNVFSDETACRRACQGRRTSPERVESEGCLHPRDDRRCGPEAVRWYYEAFSSQCYQFRYRGCSPGGNQFSSEEACRRSCVGRFTPRPLIQPTRRPPRILPPVTQRPQVQPTWRPDGEDVCGMDADPGDCKRFVKRWYYHYIEDGCFTFDYGGCGGNANNFNSEYECSNTCLGGRRVQPLATPPRRPRTTPRPNPPWRPRSTPRPTVINTGACGDPVDTRLCGEWQNRWKYNSDTDRCEQFWHGGCSERGNVFTDETACRRACQGSRRPRPDDRNRNRNNVVNDVCLYPVEKGPCRQNLLRWYFDEESRTCRTFNYGGCRGNNNRYENQIECVRTCHHLLRQEDRRRLQGDDPNNGEVCLMDQDKALCTNWTNIWFYNKTAGECQQFWHGGCDTIGNHFDSLGSCWTKCYEYATKLLPEIEPEPESETSETQKLDPEPEVEPEVKPESTNRREPAIAHTDLKVIDICTLPKDERECEELIVKWYFNGSDGKCDRFWYGGCNDDGNQFDSKADCLKMCRHHHAGAEDNRRHPDENRRHPDENRQHPDENRQHPDENRQHTDEKRRHPDESRPHPDENKQNPDEDRRNPNEDRRNPNEDRINPNVNPDDINRISPPAAEDICTMTPVAGPCRDNIVTLWFYDSDNKKCDRFRYGGCEGNGNRFETEEDCERACSQRRTGPGLDSRQPDTRQPDSRQPDSRQPDSRQPDSRQPDSRQPDNRQPDSRQPDSRQPDSRQPDSKQPDSHQSPDVQPPYNSDKEICQLSVDTGPCRASFPRWYYDTAAGKCKKFIYGGCSGNSNNFEDKKACRRRCDPSKHRHPKQEEETKRPEKGNVDNRIPADSNVCRMPKDDRFCGDWMMKWVYNQSSLSCDHVWLGNCGEGGNQFETAEDCQNLCGNSIPIQPDTHNQPDPNAVPRVGGDNRVNESGDRNTPTSETNLCFMKAEAGPCRENIVTLWFYDAGNKRCNRFRYGGCEGNGNRFETEEECQRACSERTPHIRVPVTDICSLSSDAGPCRDTIVTMWFYDSESKRCDRFRYGGCDGNGNRFETEEECRHACSQRTDTRVDTGTQRPPNREVFRPRPPTNRGSDECNSSEFGCCPDGLTPAGDGNYNTCPSLAPEILPLGKDSFKAQSGDDITIACNVLGAPKPTILWYQDGVRIPTDSPMFTIDSDGALTVTSLKISDTGEYTCTADNGVGFPASQRVNLVVQQSPVILATPSNVITAPGGTARLHCSASGSPAPQLSWLDNQGRPLRASERVSVFPNGTFIISHAQPQDAGTYTCVARSGVADPARKKVQLSIKEGVIAKIKPHDNMYLEGNVLRLECEVSGYPYPSVTWLKDDLPVNTSHKVQLHHRGEKLAVHHLTIADAGLYQCRVNNGQAEGIASTLVRVDLKDLSDGECTDPKGKVYCRIIVAASMCHRRHFARLCCESCRDWLQSPS